MDYDYLRAFRRTFDDSRFCQDRESEDPTDEPPLLVCFYDSVNPGTDSYGRSLSKILQWPDDRLETCHDYIQFLFPLPEGSPFNMAAPPVDRRVYEAFHNDEGLQKNLRSSFDRMLKFYGFKMNSSAGKVTVTKHEDWRQGFERWVRRFDHNHLRITRIIRSLRVLGLELEAYALHDALKEVQQNYGRISETSMNYWARAAERPLYLAPDDHDNAPGAGWLRKLAESTKNTYFEMESKPEDGSFWTKDEIRELTANSAGNAASKSGVGTAPDESQTTASLEHRLIDSREFEYDKDDSPTQKHEAVEIPVKLGSTKIAP